MPKTKIEQIEEGLNCLPNRDIPFAKAFLINRDIEKLYELVKSAFQKYEIDEKKPDENRRYKDVDADALAELFVLVSEYWDGIRPLEVEDDGYV